MNTARHGKTGRKYQTGEIGELLVGRYTWNPCRETIQGYASSSLYRSVFKCCRDRTSANEISQQSVQGYSMEG